MPGVMAVRCMDPSGLHLCGRQWQTVNGTQELSALGCYTFVPCAGSKQRNRRRWGTAAWVHHPHPSTVWV